MPTYITSSTAHDPTTGYARVDFCPTHRLTVQLHEMTGDRDGYEVTLTDCRDWSVLHCSTDLYTPADVGEVRALAAALGYLEACGEAYEHRMRFPESDPENLGLFDGETSELAYRESDSIAMARLDLADLGYE